MTEYLIISDPEGCGNKIQFMDGIQSSLLCKFKTFKILDKWISTTSNRNIVFCGDYFDNGTIKDIIESINTMYKLKTKYGARIKILLGNRDLNKLRLVNEMKYFEQKTDIIDTDTMYKPLEDKPLDKPCVLRKNQKDINKNFKLFYKGTMGIKADINEDNLFNFFKSFWIKNIRELGEQINPNMWDRPEHDEGNFKMIDFFKLCEIVNIDNGIFFAHGGIDLNYFNKEINLTLPNSLEHFKHLNKLLQSALLYVEYQSDKEAILELEKHFNFSVGINYLHKNFNTNKTEQYNSNLTTYYNKVISIIETDLKDKVNVLGDLTLDGRILKEKLIRQCAAYYLFLNLSFYQAHSPVICSGGITGECEDNEKMGKKLVEIYYKNNINTLVLGHKPICFPIPLGFYDTQTVDGISSTIYTFANDLTGYRYLKTASDNKDIIPLGIMKKKQNEQAIPEFSVHYLKEDNDNIILPNDVKLKINRGQENKQGTLDNERNINYLEQIVEFINNNIILESQQITKVPNTPLHNPRDFKSILLEYKTKAINFLTEHTSEQYYKYNVLEKLKTYMKTQHQVKGGGLKKRRKSRKKRSKSKKNRRKSKKNRRKSKVKKM